MLLWTQSPVLPATGGPPFDTSETMMKRPMFQNFDLYLAPRTATGYPLSVLSSPAGETLAPVMIQLDAGALAEQFRQVPFSQIDAHLPALGKKLTDALLPVGPLRDLYQRSLGMVAARNEQLRLRLRIAPAELAILPWEYLYDPNENDFLVLNPAVALVRYYAQPVPPRTVESQEKLGILVCVGAMLDGVPLDTTREINALIDALTPLLQRQIVHLHLLLSNPADGSIHGHEPGVTIHPHPATLDSIQRTLRQGYRVFHYVGHGYYDADIGGMLLLDNGKGMATAVDAITLARYISGTSVDLCFLNACESAVESTASALVGLAPRLVGAGVPAVLAMQFEIDDQSAARFAAEFYRALADGWPLDAATGEGRKAISHHPNAWGIPVLFMRSPDGQLWQEKPAASPAAESTSPAVNQGGIVFGAGSTVNARTISAGNVTEIHDNQIVFGTASAPDPRWLALQKLKAELEQGIADHALDEMMAVPVQALLQRALEQARATPPDWERVQRYLEQMQRIFHTDNSAATWTKAVQTVLQTLS